MPERRKGVHLTVDANGRAMLAVLKSCLPGCAQSECMRRDIKACSPHVSSQGVMSEVLIEAQLWAGRIKKEVAISLKLLGEAYAPKLCLERTHF